MLFTRFFALSFLFTTFGLVFSASIAAPVQTVQKRQEAEVVSILQTLLGTLNTVEPQLAAIQQAGNATDANVTPLVNQVTGALQSTAGQLANILNPFSGLKRRQSDDLTDIINEISSVIGEIISILQTFVTVQNIETLITFISDAFGAATSILNFVKAILGLIPGA
ncbi:hypothetical protein GYMLUDRAFT_250778 [Collybiopsis luxurians FD-317 M1]|uniref:Plasma membrane fusion protein PRM1 n=1 Tax=Collybiopsis luxurians FD-317 M1 TaxID=944289 RepID=A0A0D0CDB9_9AGAR|nr:hypothetical protein GYMLUDRAFT_250778 [Collybiopsis luxurians FD-317 M1]